MAHRLRRYTGRWACWEWLYDGSNNVIEFYIDSTLQACVESKGQGCVDGTDSVWQAPQFDALRIGWVNLPEQARRDGRVAGRLRSGARAHRCPAPQASAH